MQNTKVIQGRELGERDIELIRSLMVDHQDWGRTKLSEELCRRWDWRNARGRLKDMAARTLLLKLERRGEIVLPTRKSTPNNALRNRSIAQVTCSTESIHGKLTELQPLRVQVVAPSSADARLFNGLLAHHHYLGHRNTVGENMRYLLKDRQERPVACLLFGAAAWHCADRDQFIGWDPSARKRNLQGLTNNTRFLIPPWVVVPHLASHALSLVIRRIRADWMEKYGHPVHALETFVDQDRFKGTCYRAANWRHVGQTKGRTRNEKEHRIQASLKDVFIYPLVPDFQRELCK